MTDVGPAPAPAATPEPGRRRRSVDRVAGAILVGATLLGLWIGIVAPSQSPVTPPAPPAAPALSATP